MIGAAIGAVGAIAGGLMASREAKKMKRAVKRQQLQNKNWYDKNYNEDVTQRADAQRIIQQTEDAIRQRNKAAAGATAVTGATEATAAATNAQNADAMSRAMSNIAATEDARKSAIQQQYQEKDNRYNEQLNNIQAQKVNDIGNATAQMGAAIASLDAGLAKSKSKDE